MFCINNFRTISKYHFKSIFSFGINLIFLMTILIMTCEKPAYGNSSLYVFGYILLFGSPVMGHDMTMRIFEMIFGFLYVHLYYI